MTLKVLIALTLAGVGEGIANNMRPGLLPANGVWRGSTIPAAVGDIASFETSFGVPLHIYRTFKTPNAHKILPDELAFVQGGGILFYSTQPTNWTESSSAAYATAIQSYAAAVKSLAPALVMVAPGYEPDGHASEFQTKAKEVFGTSAEYKATWANYKSIFKSEGVTNALFVLDWSCNIQTTFSMAAEQLWPGDGEVDWMFFNMFQSKDYKFLTKGNCSNMFDTIYNLFDDGSAAGHDYASVPAWGLGAWGTNYQTEGDAAAGYPAKPIPVSDRELCLTDTTTNIANTAQYPRIKASIYFNSLVSIIGPDAVTGQHVSTELMPTFSDYLKSPFFTVNDPAVGTQPATPAPTSSASPASSSSCMSWCATNSEDWGVKCSSFTACTGCSACATASTALSHDNSAGAASPSASPSIPAGAIVIGSCWLVAVAGLAYVAKRHGEHARVPVQLHAQLQDNDLQVALDDNMDYAKL